MKNKQSGRFNAAWGVAAQLPLVFVILTLLHIAQLPAGAQDIKPRLPISGQLRAAALRASGAATSHGAWRVTGRAVLHGANQQFAITFDHHFRFKMAVTGVLPDIDGFDGSATWTQGPSGIPHTLELADRDINRLIVWTINGSWALPLADLTACVAPALPGYVGINLKPRGGVLTATLFLNAETHLPYRLACVTDSGNESWTFSDYKLVGPIRLPCRVVHRSGNQYDSFSVTSAGPIAPGTDFRMPQAAPGSTVFNSNANPTVAIKVLYGHLFVKALVDQHDEGWFFLDTGADVMCIDPAVAKRLKMPIIGGDTTAGVVAVTHQNLCSAHSFQLGPITYRNPVFLELDVSAITSAFKIPIAGICGYDFIARAGLDIDPGAGTMRITRTGALTLPVGAGWTHIVFNANTPCMECEFGPDSRGFFNLDTGSSGTVDFFTPAVKQYHLLAYDNGHGAHTSGAGGSALSRMGVIPWFELSSTRIERPTVGLQLTSKGVFASPYFTGNIGMGFLGRFRLLLDYRNSRVAFMATKDASQL